MQNDSSLVSIITPSYNSSSYIEETIQTILAQTYSNWELLITDDCSSDNSVEIIQKYMEKDKRIKLFHLECNSGAGVARNHSIKEAKGRFIAFCDSDDRWMPDKLEKQIIFMRENNYSFTYSSYYSIREGETRAKVISFPNRISSEFLLRDCIGCLTVIYDTDSVGKVYMPVIRKRQDWALWQILIRKCKYAYGLREPLAIYRVRKGAISSNKFALVKHNIGVYRNILHFSVIKSYFIFIFLFMPTYVCKKITFKLGRYQNAPLAILVDK